MKKLIVLLLCTFIPFLTSAQGTEGKVEGIVSHNGKPVPGVNVGIKSIQKGSATDEEGRFLIKNLPPGTYTIEASAVGYRSVSREINIEAGKTLEIQIALKESLTELDRVVVTGTMRETYV